MLFISLGRQGHCHHLEAVKYGIITITSAIREYFNSFSTAAAFGVVLQETLRSVQCGIRSDLVW